MIPLKPIKPKRISDQVFEQLRDLIFRSKLKPGEKLMSERELCEALNVSRTTVRSAINKLVVMGYLDQRQGQGTFVRSPNARVQNPLAQAIEAKDASLEDLLEVRMGLECNAAALAAQRALEKDIQFLEETFKEMKREVMSGNLGTEADVSFHMAIAYATHNPVQIYMMRNFYDLLFFGIRENLQKLYEKPKRIDIILRQHRAILDSIRAHDSDQAYENMKHHITFVLDFVRNLE